MPFDSLPVPSRGFTRQEVFNLAYLGIMSQGRPGKPAGSQYCSYHSSNGDMCAVGHVLGETIAREWANAGFGSIDRTDPRALPEHLRMHRGFLLDLQYIHDNASVYPNFLAEYHHRMVTLAEKYCLRIPDTPQARSHSRPHTRHRVPTLSELRAKINFAPLPPEVLELESRVKEKLLLEFHYDEELV